MNVPRACGRPACLSCPLTACCVPGLAVCFSTLQFAYIFGILLNSRRPLESGDIFKGIIWLKPRDVCTGRNRSGCRNDNGASLHARYHVLHVNSGRVQHRREVRSLTRPVSPEQVAPTTPGLRRSSGRGAGDTSGDHVVIRGLGDFEIN